MERQNETDKERGTGNQGKRWVERETRKTERERHT